MHKHILTAIFLQLIAFNSYAFKLVPMEAEFAPEGARATHTFTIENAQRERIAVEIQLFKRSSDESGKEVREATDEFNVYPDQLQLEPGEKRNVNVTWIGGAIADKERAFRLVASQLPVKLNAENKQLGGAKVDLRFVIQYVASLYVRKNGQEPRLKVASIEKATEKANGKVSASSGGEKAVVTIVNEGTAHQVIREASLNLWVEKDSKRTKEITVGSSQLKELELDNLLAGESRKIEFTLPKELRASEKIQGEIKLKAQ